MRADNDRMPVVLQVGRSAPPGSGGAVAPTNDLVARAAEMILVEVESAGDGTFLADCFSGLSPAPGVVVRFLGHDWDDLSPDEAGALRGLIGRHFARGGWIGY